MDQPEQEPSPLFAYFASQFGLQEAVGLSMAFSLARYAPEWFAYQAADWTARYPIAFDAEVARLFATKFPVPPTEVRRP